MHLHIIDRKTAKANGLKRYFTGKPCANGNANQRLVSAKTCQCKECLREAANRKVANSSLMRDAIAKRQSEYYRKNREEINRRARQDRAENPEKYAAYYADVCKERRAELARSRYWKNREAELESQARRRAQNPEKAREYYRRSYEKRKGQYVFWALKRKAIKLERTPLWYGELDDFCVSEALSLAKDRKSATGLEWDVDHSIPLKAKNACGLHCAHNLQVIPSYLNSMKHNKMIFTEPFEWMAHG